MGPSLASQTLPPTVLSKGLRVRSSTSPVGRGIAGVSPSQSAVSTAVSQRIEEDAAALPWFALLAYSFVYRYFSEASNLET